MTLRYEGLWATFDMPGWYCGKCQEGIHRGEDMQESDRQLNLLKAQAANGFLPSEYLEQRAKRGDRAKFEQALAKVPDVPPDAHDLLPEIAEDLSVANLMAGADGRSA